MAPQLAHRSGEIGRLESAGEVSEDAIPKDRWTSPYYTHSQPPVRVLAPSSLPRDRLAGSGISKKHHESKVHVTLVVAMEESRTGIACGEIHFCGRVCRNHQHVLI